MNYYEELLFVPSPLESSLETPDIPKAIWAGRTELCHSVARFKWSIKYLFKGLKQIQLKLILPSSAGLIVSCSVAV